LAVEVENKVHFHC